MPKFIPNTVIKYQHSPSSKPEHFTAPDAMPNYGTKIQHESTNDQVSTLSDEDKKFVQRAIGTILHYACALDNTMLTELSDLLSEQSIGNEKTLIKLKQTLNYVQTHHNARMRYCESMMIIQAHIDTSYLSAPKSRSRTGGDFFLGRNPMKPDKSKLNVAILVV